MSKPHSPSKAVLGALLLASTVSLAHAQGTQADTDANSSDATSTYASEPSAGMMAFDLLLVRPLSLAATAVGTALFVVDLPLAVFQKDAPAAPFHQLVVNPARYTFTRPLGALN